MGAGKAKRKQLDRPMEPGTMATAELAAVLRDLAEGLDAGVLRLGEAEIGVTDRAEAELDVRHKRDRIRLSLELCWRDVPLAGDEA